MNIIINTYIFIYIYKTPKVTDKIITKMINNQLDITLGQFTQEELDIVLTKIKKTEIPPDVWKTRKSNDLLLQYCCI